MLYDCHAHFYPPNFTSEEILELSGFHVLSVSENLKEAVSILELSQKNPLVHACAGLHPVQQRGQSVAIEDWGPMGEFISRNQQKLVAIGECGLDFSTPDLKANKDVQQQVFQKHIDAALKYQLPLNVHSRDAGHYAIDQLIQSNAIGLMHAFNGKTSYALKGASHGLYFSIPPIIARESSFEKLVKALPMDKLVLESDAPALSPVKGVKNAIENITVSVREISKLKNVSIETVERLTTENALKLFPKLLLA